LLRLSIQACAADAPAAVICERGVRANDTEDGALTDTVKVRCERVGSTATQSAAAGGYLFSEVGLSGCGLDTTFPGVWRLTFSVTDSAGQLVTAIRTLAVPPSCDPGERLCSAAEVCSVDGVCLTELLDIESPFADLVPHPPLLVDDTPTSFQRP
jgi:hypothetical protein